MDTAVAVVSQCALDTDEVSEDAAQLIKEIGIPPCPKVLVDFMTEAGKDEPDFLRLSHLINKDVALAASVLKTINSPYYGLPRKARTVHDALTLLGLRPASRLIAGLLLRQAFAQSQSPAMQEFWESSSKIALLTGYLARELDCAKLEEAHTFALFRDCGIPVILMRHPEYEQVLAMTRNETEHRRSEMERAQFGFDHARVGAELAQTWHLPSETCAAIRIHNSYTESDFGGDSSNSRFAPLIALGLLAEQLHRVHRATFDAEAWTTEEAFIAHSLGPVQVRLESLAEDIARILAQS